MNIAIVTELFAPSVGGQEVRYAQLADRLVNEGHNITIFTIGHEEGLASREKHGDVLIERLVDAPGYVNRKGGLSRNPVVIFRFAFALLFRIARLRGFDAVIFNIWPLMPQIMCGPLLGKKAIVDWCELRTGLKWTVFYRLMVATSAKHIGVSEEISEKLITNYGTKRGRTTAILSGIESSKFLTPSAAEREYILFFGRLSPHKNPDLVLKAYLNSKELRKRTDLVIAGGGELLEEIRALAKDVPEVKILGWIDEEEKVALLQKAWLLVLPSRREGFPRVIAEAAGAGTPVLTVNYPDNGSVGVVRRYGLGGVCESDERALSQAMKSLLENAEEWQTISQNNQQMAKAEFDWAAVTKKLVDFLR